MGFTIKMEGLEQGLKLFQEEADDAVRKGLFAAGTIALNAANNDIPKPPLKWGTLRGSGSIDVRNGRSAKADYPIRTDLKGTPGEILEPDLDGMERLSVRISYNTSYAARLHESPNWDAVPKDYAPGEEIVIADKWLERGLKESEDEMRQALVEVLKRELRG